MTIRKVSVLITAACLFAFLVAPMRVAAQDYDGDGTLDASDPCPHIAGATPLLMSSPYLKFDYGSNGVAGGGDDEIKLKKNGAFFVTHEVYDPDSIDNVHITIRRNSNTGADLWATTLPAGPPWTQVPIGGGRQQWNYQGASAPGATIFNGLLRNAKVSPAGSGLQRLTIKKAQDTDINGALSPDLPITILEVEHPAPPFSGFCFATTTATCTYGSGSDVCLP